MNKINLEVEEIGKKKEGNATKIKVGCCGFPTSREKYFKEFDTCLLYTSPSPRD